MNAPAPKRLSKFKREPKAVADKKLTARSLEAIKAVARYRFLPTSLLVRLIEGNEDVTHRHLQRLFHKGLINRFAFPKLGGSSEFNYYLDNPKALRLIVEQGLANEDDLDYEGVRRNREKAYHRAHESADAAGRTLFLQHEIMISRFHFMVEMGCKQSEGQIQLAAWRQGPELHSSVTDLDTGEVLPHRPDAFFSLHFPNEQEGQNRSNFFYEADRRTTSIPKMVKKFKAHLEFIRQKQHQERYGIRRIRAVLIETLDTKWAQELRQASMPICPVPLFWFSASEIFTANKPKAYGNGIRNVPLFLMQPEIVLKKVWATTDDNSVVGLAD